MASSNKILEELKNSNKPRFKLLKYAGHLTPYMVSTFGDVWNIVTGFPLSLHKDKGGYLRVSLTIDGKTHNPLVHRLVAMTFIPNPDDKEDVHHIDGNRTNNHVDNLEWLSKCEHAEEHAGSKAKGEKSGNCKYNEEQILGVIEDLEKHIPLSTISVNRGVNRNSLINIIEKKTWFWLTEGKDFSFYTKSRRKYTHELRQKIYQLLKEGLSTKQVCDMLSWEYTPVNINYIKRMKNRYILHPSSTTIERIARGESPIVEIE